MKKPEVIAQLKDLIENSQSFITRNDDEDTIWHKDIVALKIAIKAVDEMDEMEESNESGAD